MGEKVIPSSSSCSFIISRCSTISFFCFATCIFNAAISAAICSIFESDPLGFIFACLSFSLSQRKRAVVFCVSLFGIDRLPGSRVDRAGVVLIHGAPPSGYPSRCQGRRTVLCSPAIFRGGAHLTFSLLRRCSKFCLAAQGQRPAAKATSKTPSSAANRFALCGACARVCARVRVLVLPLLRLRLQTKTQYEGLKKTSSCEERLLTRPNCLLIEDLQGLQALF